jgi:hypothetical protein
MRATCEIACAHTQVVSSECGQFTYHTISWGYRATVQAVTKDAIRVNVGGVTGAAPAANWQPLQIEASVCETVDPIAPFSLFGAAQTAPTIVGRTAATMVPIITEWPAPGVPNYSNGNPFQETETSSGADTYAGMQPRDWYQTSFPAALYYRIVNLLRHDELSAYLRF